MKSACIRKRIELDWVVVENYWINWIYIRGYLSQTIFYPKSARHQCKIRFNRLNKIVYGNSQWMQWINKYPFASD